MIRYLIPMLNVGKARPEWSPHGTHMPRRYLKYQDKFKALLLQLKPKPRDGNNVMVVVVNGENAVLGDTDNHAGSVMDCCGEDKRSKGNGILYNNDRKVVAQLCIRNDSKSDGMTALKAIKGILDQMTKDDFRRVDETVFYVEYIEDIVPNLFSEPNEEKQNVQPTTD